MNIHYSEMRVVDLFEVERKLRGVLKFRDAWVLLDKLFGVDEPSNDSYYRCQRPDEDSNVHSEFDCTRELMHNTIVPAIWGDNDCILVRVSW